MGPRTKTMMELLTMDGHGIYVWSAYILTITVLLGLGSYPFIRLARFKQRHQEDNEPK
ncbi:MAG: heme exporter protein CcmD [Gammaproteobacteria bacterium]|nr:heme exporter protein CcmD [Gammaproteobacteria bacterium]MYF02952.1 heme exporter protein CcmD [Gammaproteobacteria bacterium]